MKTSTSIWRIKSFCGFFAKSRNVSLYVALDYFFDFPLYYFMVRQLGLVVGGGITIALGFIIDLAIFKWYSKRNDDVFGLERIKSYRDYDGDNKRRLWIAKWMKRSDLFTMCFIAFFSNPCLTLIYMRRKHNSNRDHMNYKDWLIFMFSLLIEFMWATVIWGAVLFEIHVLQPIIYHVF